MLAFRRVWAARMDSTPLAALAAFLLANVMAYLVAFQVYGDPLIVFFLGFGLGLVLSASRLGRMHVGAARAAEERGHDENQQEAALPQDGQITPQRARARQ
jgi:hypothetical protein